MKVKCFTMNPLFDISNINGEFDTMKFEYELELEQNDNANNP